MHPNILDNGRPSIDNGQALNMGYLISIFAHFQSHPSANEVEVIYDQERGSALSVPHQLDGFIYQLWYTGYRYNTVNRSRTYFDRRINGTSTLYLANSKHF